VEDFAELIYLQELNRKFGRYWKQYFGFTAQNIGDKLGMSKQQFSKILGGKQPLKPELMPVLKKAYEDLDIYGKTRDFKESDLQKWRREKNHNLNK
jgi:transcriptional regulator with XRE-family HTH domain